MRLIKINNDSYMKAKILSNVFKKQVITANIKHNRLGD